MPAFGFKYGPQSASNMGNQRSLNLQSDNLGRNHLMKEIATPRAILFIAVGAVSLPLTASSATMLTAKNGRTLYVFDRDTGGVPTCYDACAKQWPPYLAKEGQKMGEGWG